MAERPYPIRTRVRIDTVDAYCLPGDLDVGRPTVLDGLAFTWGRSTVVDQPEVGSCTFTIREQTEVGTVPMASLIAPDAQVEVWIDADMPNGTVRTLMVWAGSVASATGQAVSDQAIEVAVTATESIAVLADKTIGDVPWEVEPAGNRAHRILDLANTDTSLRVDSTLADILLSRLDVDSQTPLDLLHNVAQSVGGVLWATTVSRVTATGVSSRPQLWLEDPARRPSRQQFVIKSDTQVVIEETTSGAALLTANDLLRDPVQWLRDKTSSINSVDVSWLEQTTDDDGQPATEDRVTRVTRAGTTIVRTLSVDTELVSELEADKLAGKWLATMDPYVSWTASGLSLDTRLLQRDVADDVAAGLDYAQRLDVVLSLLNSVDRIGAAFAVENMPTWAPHQGAVYTEGGTYTWEDGRWMLDLNVSIGNGESARFIDFSGTEAQPIDFGTIRGIDAWGVAGPDTLPPFYDMEREGDTAYVSAHRGGSYIVPEGTTVGRVNALELGMQVIDGGDIHSTKDGVLYDMHDLTVDRTTNLTGLLSEMTSAELQQGVIDCSVWFGGGWQDQPITSIADTLDELGGRAYITLEIKSETGALENCAKAVNMITERGLRPYVLIASFTESLLAPAIAAGMEVMLLGSTGTAVDGADLLSKGIRYFGGSVSMTSETAAAIANTGVRVVTYSTEQHADVNKYRDGPSGHLYGYISDDPYYLKGHVLGDYAYRRTTDPFDSLTWYHGFQPDNWDMNPASRGSFTDHVDGAFYCAPVRSERRAILQGWACPLESPTSYSITWEQDYLQAATSAGGALVFGCPDDMPYTGDDQAGGGAGPTAGYIAILFTSGLIRLFRRDPDGVPVQLGSVSGTTITPGVPTRLSVTVTPTQITFRKEGAATAPITVTDSTYRGAYVHLLCNDQGGAAGVRWRNITIGDA